VALFQRHFEIHEEILKLFVPFHAERNEPVTRLEGPQGEREAKLFSIEESCPCGPSKTRALPVHDLFNGEAPAYFIEIIGASAI
jgi:hypothetical protein